MQTDADAGAATGPRNRLRGPKYFIIGLNKTGTTSVRDEFGMLGFKVANFRTAQKLANECYFDGDWQPIIDFCRTAQVFKDAPFSYPGTFREIDAALPGNRFILTVRDSDEQWCDSLIRFHSRMFGRGGIPTAEDLQRAGRRRGMWLKKWSWRWRGFRLTLERRTPLPVNVTRLYGTTPEDPYNRERLKAAYNRHNREVAEHFADRPGDLLVINVSRPDDYEKFLKFVGMSAARNGFPWSRKGS